MRRVKWRAWEEPGVSTHKLNKETPQWHPDQIQEEYIPCTQLFGKTSRNPQQQHKADGIPDHFIEKEGLETHSIGIEYEIIKRWNTMGRIDTQAPGQSGGRII